MLATESTRQTAPNISWQKTKKLHFLDMANELRIFRNGGSIGKTAMVLNQIFST